MLNSSTLSEASRAESLKLCHLNLSFVGQLIAAIRALLLSVLLRSSFALSSILDGPVGWRCPTSLWLRLLLHVGRFGVRRAFWIFTILVVLYMHCVLFTFHALEIVSSPLELIVIVLYFWLVLRSLLLPIVPTSHVGVLHRLNATVRHVVLLSSRGVHSGLVSLLLRFLVILLALLTDFLAVAKICKFGITSVANVHLFLVVVSSSVGFDRRVPSLANRVGVV